MKLKLLSLVLLASLALAKEPNRPECIAPAKPGGGFDLTCKLAQVSLKDTKLLSKPMRTTYMPGGLGVTAYTTMNTSKSKDPNAIVAFSSGTLLNIATGKHGKYDENDVKWLTSVGVDYGIVAVKSDSPYKNLQDLLEALKKDPKAISFGAAGSVGGQDWMQTALLAKAAGVDISQARYVAFEGGGEALTSLLGGHIDVISQGMSETIPHLEAGTVRVLAVFADERLKVEGKAADVLTAKEQGYNVVWPTIRGFYMAPNTPDAAYQWWLDTFTKLQETKDFQEQRDVRGLFEFNKNGAELDAFVKEQVKTFRQLAKEYNLVK
ncbi:Bug family tripartite tricarboxylate transporter substrate binding protein [Helicobacter sp.]|uniref:Bug family tripartite tricarboxylate transporter substrate binding protein n=1 Tax=Helicobacter sp. TaxID=218 RepID=UPI0025BEE9D9|nr:tripartite tricarboxylate transporter substrate binding protein [Helicobacter sp.]MCI5968473.1 tripartite tricarboxylate transporter substrate binding protein [Helicobacter sp.]MDY2585258.1 tripartite tricarboxylate transporter substrate binding protein [Helicobacter sp.]